MLQPTLITSRCILRAATVDDTCWLYELFNDQDVIKYIEGINCFNADISAIRRFLNSMNKSFQKGLGILWCILYMNRPIGMIMVNDLNDQPFYTFALLPTYRGLELMKECIVETNNFIHGYYNQKPTITTLDSNVSALRLMRKLSELKLNTIK